MVWAQVAGDSVQPRLTLQLPLKEYLHTPITDADSLQTLCTATSKAQRSALQRLVECVEQQLIQPLFVRAETRREKRIETEVLTALIQRAVALDPSAPSVSALSASASASASAPSASASALSKALSPHNAHEALVVAMYCVMVQDGYSPCAVAGQPFEVRPTPLCDVM